MVTPRFLRTRLRAVRLVIGPPSSQSARRIAGRSGRRTAKTLASPVDFIDGMCMSGLQRGAGSCARESRLTKVPRRDQCGERSKSDHHVPMLQAGLSPPLRQPLSRLLRAEPARAGLNRHTLVRRSLLKRPGQNPEPTAFLSPGDVPGSRLPSEAPILVGRWLSRRARGRGRH